jgi:hypothetical protein
LAHRYWLWQAAITMATCCIYLTDVTYVMFSGMFDEPRMDVNSLAYELARHLDNHVSILEERNYFLLNRFQTRQMVEFRHPPAAAAAAPAAPNPPPQHT